MFVEPGDIRRVRGESLILSIRMKSRPSLEVASSVCVCINVFYIYVEYIFHLSKGSDHGLIGTLALGGGC